MSKSHIDAIRRQLAQAESSNDVTIAKLKGAITFMEKALRERQERDDAIISALNEDRIALQAQVTQVVNEITSVIGDLTGAPKVIEGGSEQRQVSERAA